MHTIQLKGSGPPLLFLHGWGQSHRELLPLAELLTPVTTPYLLDLPGFGQSPPPDSVWSAFDYAAQIADFLKQKKLSRISLMGHSFGGKVALAFAVRYPEHVEKLILAASAGICSKGTFLQRARKQTLLTVGKQIKWMDTALGTRFFHNFFAPRFGSKDYNQAGTMRSILVKSVNEDLSCLLPKIDCPTLLLWGERDRDTPLEMGERMKKLIPKARLYRFLLHDHQLIQGTGSQLLATYIIRFLRRPA